MTNNKVNYNKVNITETKFYTLKTPPSQNLRK